MASKTKNDLTNCKITVFKNEYRLENKKITLAVYEKPILLKF